MDEWLSLGVLLLIGIQLWMFFKKPRDLPPGPLRLPIIGNLHNLGKKPHQSLAKLAKIHGPLMSLQLGSLTTVIVSSPLVAQQVLQKHDLVFSNRWVPDAISVSRHNEFGLSFAPNNPTWRNLRKFCTSQLFSNKSLDASQHLRKKKVEELISYINGCCRDGVAVNISLAVFSSNFNLISNTLFSLDLEDPHSAFCREFKETISQLVYLAGQPNIGDYFPLLKILDLQRIGRRMEKNFGKTFDFFQRVIDERLLKGIDQTTESTDVLDAMLKINHENKEELGMSDILHTLLDLLIGGTDTAASTIEWAMVELLRDQSRLKKAQAELDQIIGKGNNFKEGDIKRLPYLQAVVKETLRLHPPAPLLIPRVASSDVNLCGFRVPKDSQVFINVYAIGRDPSVWEKPYSFEPERFLGSEIEFNKGQLFQFLPFGGGRRICPGLLLGYRNLYLILGSMIHSFDWKLEDGVEPDTIDMEEKFGLGVQKATPFYAVPVSRI